MIKSIQIVYSIHFTSSIFLIYIVKANILNYRLIQKMTIKLLYVYLSQKLLHNYLEKLPITYHLNWKMNFIQNHLFPSFNQFWLDLRSKLLQFMSNYIKNSWSICISRQVRTLFYLYIFYLIQIWSFNI